MRNLMYGVGSLIVSCSFLLMTSCSKSDDGTGGQTAPQNFSIRTSTVDGTSTGATLKGVTLRPAITVSFSAPLDPAAITGAIEFHTAGGIVVAFSAVRSHEDSVLVIQPGAALSPVTAYELQVTNRLKSKAGGSLVASLTIHFTTSIDSSDKFPRIADDSLLTLVQKQTFTYFWDFGHPVSGLARERNTSGETVTTGGSGFGIMTIPVAINRNFITRTQGLARLQQIVSFLKSTAESFHGAFPHWMNGSTGQVVPFAANDDGADIVETSYLMMGLLTARQFFDGTSPQEIGLRNDINSLWNAVEWDWFTQGGKHVLYWNWSANSGFAINVPVQGWNETLISYVLAASSPTHPVPRAAYDSGFARNGAMKNGASYFGYPLPLGEAQGGPLFFEHYSFLGIDPNGLTDQYADYTTQTKNHSLINYQYCVSNPRHYYGYSADCWGLTASDIPGGYTASSPANDVGVIAPTAAISSLPYTPTQSMAALRFFYYKLGDRLWGANGFRDAFDLDTAWFADSYLAIDEGPIVVMIENYRSGLPWQLFTSCPEIRSGLVSLGFSAPYL